ncbi:MAG: ArsR family transcriptional regulator [Elusimicrobia bacterium]|nr:ArsR family transcriptional regulator [Elusimicrobiota bacterium]
MASHWGLNRTECQIHGLLFLSEKALDAEDISQTLSIARSHVSASLKELQGWGIVRVVHKPGSRREFFECPQDVWEIFRTVVNEQKRREIDPWRRILRETAAAMEDGGKETAYARRRVLEMQEFFETCSGWFDEMRGISTPMMKRFLTLGGKVVSMLGLRKG